MLRQKLPSGILSLLVVMIFDNVPAWTAESVPADRLLPPPVYAYATIPSVADFKAKWSKSLLGRLQQDQALAEFGQDLRMLRDRVSEELAKRLGLTLADLFATLDGELTFAIVQPEEGKPGVVALLDFGDRRQVIDKLLEGAKTASANQGIESESEEYGGTRIVVYRRADGDSDRKPKRSAAFELAYFVKDARLVVGSSLPALKDILDRWDGKHPKTLAASDTYRYVMDRCRGEGSAPVFKWYVDPIGLLNAANRTFGQGNLQMQLVMGFLPTLGLTKLKAVGGTVDMVTGDFETISRVLIYVDQPLSGILKVFEFPATEQSPPNWVSDDASIYFGLNWNVAGAYTAVETLFDMFKQPGAFAQLIASIAEKPNGPGLHLKKDVVDQLTGRIHLLREEPEADNSQQKRVLFAVEVKDAAQAAEVLASVARKHGFADSRREVGGKTLYELPVGGRLGGDSQQKGAIAVIEGHLMASTDIAVLERIARADGKQHPLAESTAYRRLAKHFPAKMSVLEFERHERGFHDNYELLRTGRFDFEGLDFTKLPPFKAIEKYFPAKGSYFVPDERGALGVIFSLRETDD